jgi:hypothetical protein
MKLAHQELLNEVILLGPKEVNVLGPDLALNQSHLELETDANGLVVAGLRMMGGTLRAKRPLKNFHFERAHFVGVQFSGTFVGCDFGDWESPSTSSVSDCDFSSANLDGCRFLNCDPRTIKFPPWPCFTILSPSAAKSFVAEASEFGKLRVFLSIYTDEDPKCVAIVGNAFRVAEKYRLDLAHMKEQLSLVPGFCHAPSESGA